MATGDQIQIPCVMMRGGTSRGPLFLASDLPADPNQRDALLLSIMGAGHDLEIDGIGGGNPLTSKVATVGPSTVPGADVDYLFAQVKVTKRTTFDINTFSVHGNPQGDGQGDGKTFHLWAKDHEGWLTMDATAVIQ